MLSLMNDFIKEQEKKKSGGCEYGWDNIFKWELVIGWKLTRKDWIN